MHNRELTHIMNTESSKYQFIVKTKYSVCCQLRETYIKTKKAKARVETLKIQILLLPPFVLNI